MKIKTFGFEKSGRSEVLKAALTEFGDAAGTCSFVAVHYRANSLVPTELSGVAGAVHCATSCNGVMSDDGLSDIGVFAISDPDGDYGTACSEISGDTFEAARRVTAEAISRAGRDGEAPDLIWISITPGTEEDAILGIEDVVGKGVPIIGGSAADDTVTGDWAVSDGKEMYQSGLVVSVLFCSTPLHFAYQNGYEPTPNTGVVTRSEGRRLIEIDNKSAGEVYAEWNRNSVPSAIDAEPVNILSEATLWPLGRQIGSLGEVPYYLLVHPCGANPDGSIDLFAEVGEGETLTQMTGDKTALAARAGRVAEFTLKSGDMAQSDVAGALMVYCGGCMLAVQDKLDDVYSGVNTALDHKPFLGVFTFGEQGSVHGAGNRHGNLMISCIAFSRGE